MSSGSQEKRGFTGERAGFGSSLTRSVFLPGGGGSDRMTVTTGQDLLSSGPTAGSSVHGTHDQGDPGMLNRWRSRLVRRRDPNDGRGHLRLKRQDERHSAQRISRESWNELASDYDGHLPSSCSFQRSCF
jgi:hypothetical protein